MVEAAQELRCDQEDARRGRDRVQRVGRDRGGGEGDEPALRSREAEQGPRRCAMRIQSPWLVSFVRTYGTYVYDLWNGAASQVDCDTYRTHLEVMAATTRKTRKRSTLPSRRRGSATSRSANSSCWSRSGRTRRCSAIGAIAVGPFARLDANAVAAREGKTRGAITNLFGSQAAFQAETMALALNAGEWVERVEFPAPADFPTPKHGRRVPGRPIGARAASTAPSRP